jgi:regulator of sirC expression with transglutaminase-like and TPR domain
MARRAFSDEQEAELAEQIARQYIDHDGRKATAILPRARARLEFDCN